MPAPRDAFAHGEIPREMLPTLLQDLELLNGEWEIVKDGRSDGLTCITDSMGEDSRDRQAWEVAEHLNPPKMRLQYQKNQEGISELKITGHRPIAGDYSRAIVFDGIEKPGVQLREVLHSSLLHSAPGFDTGTLIAQEIDGILFVKYQADRGEIYMTRAVLREDPLKRISGPITIGRYCVRTNAGEEHTAYRYHQKA